MKNIKFKILPLYIFITIILSGFISSLTYPDKIASIIAHLFLWFMQIITIIYILTKVN